MQFDRLLEKVYGEVDFGRSVATALAGCAGLATYLIGRDPVVAVFTAVIVFPAVRIAASAAHQRSSLRRREIADREARVGRIEKYSEDEKTVLRAFVKEGGTLLPCSRINRMALPQSGVESLVNRGDLRTTMTADCMSEAMAMEPELFELARELLSDS